MHSGHNSAGIKDPAGLEASIASATRALLDMRQPDGHWVFELEADCTIPAEYVLLRHYLGEPVDTVLEGMKPHLSFAVENKLSDDPNAAQLKVDLKFRKFEVF